MGVACAGDPLGGLVMAPVIQLLFETYSYSGTMLILAAFSMHLVMAGLLMIRLVLLLYQLTYMYIFGC